MVRNLLLGQVQLLLVPEVGGARVARPWELTNGVGKEKIIMLVFNFALESIADHHDRKKLNVAVEEISTRVSTS